MNAHPDILGLGCIAVDDLLTIPHYPQPDTKIEVLCRERQCGGLTATALVAAARLGARTAYGGSLGTDGLSEFALAQLRAANVDTEWVRRTTGAAPVHSTILVDQQSGQRNIFYDLSRIVPLPADWPEEAVVRGSKALCIDHFSVEAQLRAARICRDQGIPVIADFERHDVDGFADLLAVTDHLILSREFAERMTSTGSPQDAIRSLWNEGRRLVAVTCGDQGCYFAHADDGPRRAPGVLYQPAFVVDVVDTTGCGDVFHGAYAAALIGPNPIPDAICFAAAAAALKATRRGGQAGAPDREEVQTLLSSYGG